MHRRSLAQDGLSLRGAYRISKGEIKYESTR